MLDTFWLVTWIKMLCNSTWVMILIFIQVAVFVCSTPHHSIASYISNTLDSALYFGVMVEKSHSYFMRFRNEVVVEAEKEM